MYQDTPLHILTTTNSDNEYDELNYAYITITGAGLVGLYALTQKFDEFSKDCGAWKAAFPLLEGVNCVMLETVPDEVLEGWDENLCLFLEEPLSDEVLSQEIDFRLCGADILLTGGHAFYLRDLYKHDRGGVESAELSLKELSEEMKKLQAKLIERK